MISSAHVEAATISASVEDVEMHTCRFELWPMDAPASLQA
jgi:hypothetical protein